MIIREHTKTFLYFLVITILLCSVAEFTLLHLKYKFLTGEDNLPYPLLGSVERMGFIVIFLSLNTIFYAGIFALINYILKRFNISTFTILFHSMMICTITTAAILVLQFQLHKFFADAMDAALIKNIVGGDIRTALLYVMDESWLLIFGGVTLLVCYCIASRFILLRFSVKLTKQAIIPLKKNKLLLAMSLSALCWLPTSIYALNTVDYLRYNLNKTNAYSIFTASLDYLSDIDNDAFGSFNYPRDFSIFNPKQYPGALDIPDNGIDENGLFGDLKLMASPTLPAYKITETPKHIVIIIMESTRYDVLNKTIAGRLVAPNLTALAKEGQSIAQAYSHTGYTGPSLATFFSGQIGAFEVKQSLFSILKQLGYQLALFSGQDESWGGLDQKLATRIVTDRFYDAQTGKELRVFDSTMPVSIKLDEKNLWQEFEKYSATLNWHSPQFIYFNMQAAHFPYYHSKMTKTFVDKAIPRELINHKNEPWLRKTYWNAVHHADIYLGKIITELKRQNIWQDTLMIIAGDHGEELFDHDHLGHGSFISDVQTHIPLVINQRNFHAIEPVGQSDMKDNILSYALGQQTARTINSQHKKSVFQLIGNLEKPAKIALRYNNNKQITLDLKHMMVRPFGEDKWLPYRDAMADQQINYELKTLVNHWESLKWRSHLVTRKSNQAAGIIDEE